MILELSKRQKQDLGLVLKNANHDPSEDFLFTSVESEDTPNRMLVHRDSSNTFWIYQRPPGGLFTVQWTIPGTSQIRTADRVNWENVVHRVGIWSEEVRDEEAAVDPWEELAEQMAQDDGYFSTGELPKVDLAIDAAVEDLKSKALEKGKTLDDIQDDLVEIKKTLKTNARTSTKKEWLNIFGAYIAGKILDWGLGEFQGELFQSMLKVMLSSAEEVTYLAEHAVRYIQ